MCTKYYNDFHSTQNKENWLKQEPSLNKWSLNSRISTKETMEPIRWELTWRQKPSTPFPSAYPENRLHIWRLCCLSQFVYTLLSSEDKAARWKPLAFRIQISNQIPNTAWLVRMEVQTGLCQVKCHPALCQTMSVDGWKHNFTTGINR